MRAKGTKKKSNTDWERLQEMRDKDIDFSGVPELDKNFFKRATLRLPKNKVSVSLRLDPDVLEWFKHQGRGYQTRINAVLRMYIDAKTSH